MNEEYADRHRFAQEFKSQEPLDVFTMAANRIDPKTTMGSFEMLARRDFAGAFEQLHRHRILANQRFAEFSATLIFQIDPLDNKNMQPES